jgi:hypothetical protein
MTASISCPLMVPPVSCPLIRMYHIVLQEVKESVPYIRIYSCVLEGGGCAF